MYLYEVALTENGKFFLFNIPAQIVDEALRFDFENPVNNPFKRNFGRDVFCYYLRHGKHMNRINELKGSHHKH